MYEDRWVQLAHLFGYTPDQIQALTLNEFMQAVEYLKGRVTDGG